MRRTEECKPEVIARKRRLIKKVFRRAAAAGLTMAQLAKTVGIQQATVSNIKNFRADPSMYTFVALLAAVEEAENEKTGEM